MGCVNCLPIPIPDILLVLLEVLWGYRVANVRMDVDVNLLFCQRLDEFILSLLQGCLSFR